MVAKNMAECLVKKVGCRMVVQPATVMVNLHAKAGANADLALGDIGAMHKHAGRRLEGVDHVALPPSQQITPVSPCWPPDSA